MKFFVCFEFFKLVKKTFQNLKNNDFNKKMWQTKKNVCEYTIIYEHLGLRKMTMCQIGFPEHSFS